MTKKFSKLDWIEKLTATREVPDPVFRTAIALAGTANSSDGKNAHPGRLLLASMRALHPNSIDNHLRLLRELGWIERTAKGSNSGRRKLADVYRLRYPSTEGSVSAHGVVTEDSLRTPDTVATPSRHSREDSGGVESRVGSSEVAVGSSEVLAQNDPWEVPNTHNEEVNTHNLSCDLPGVTPPGPKKTSRSVVAVAPTLHPAPLPPTFTPTWSHKVQAKDRWLDLEQTLEEFKAQMAHVRRRDWNSTFSAYIREAEDGSQYDRFPAGDLIDEGSGWCCNDCKNELPTTFKCIYCNIQYNDPTTTQGA